ncbi:MAG TPA: hypothetical protein VE870_05150 [Bacteroidales bacterium]|nr:hypothetical protein [Bacteroidales bacterium]
MTSQLHPFLLILFVFLSAVSFGQNKEDVIYLSNGSIIRGLILEDSLKNNVRILNHAGDTWSFSQESIDTITREKPFEYNAFMFYKPGIEIELGGSLLARSNNNVIGKSVIPEVDLGIGYRFRSGISPGAKVSVAFYEWTEIPLSAVLRWRTSSRSVSPVIFLESGYTLPAEERDDNRDYSYSSKGGMHVTAGIGIERILNENSSLILEFSYHYQELKYHLTPLHDWIRERDRTETFNRLKVSVGYVFK